MIYYLPLESYKNRYTMQWSAPKTGWLERRWNEINLNYLRIEGEQVERDIKVGSVVDGIGRSLFCFSQIKELLTRAEKGLVTDEDVIYFDDFWHPGIEALPYAFHLLGIQPRMYAFLHAQSVDEFDFTYPMRHWMRHFEKGIGEVLDGIFVCGPCLQSLVHQGGIAPLNKIHVTGHPFASDEVASRMPRTSGGTFGNFDPSMMRRKMKVVFSSRWDTEKNPLFFLAVAEQVINILPNASFVICTGATELRSNNQINIQRLNELCLMYPENIVLRTGLTKEEYYRELATAKVQMNTADQDFVAITLLEASVAGCYPIYPYFRSFPETFEHQAGYMYERLDVASAADLVCSVLVREDLWTKGAIESRKWIHTRFDTSWERMLDVMFGAIKPKSNPYKNDPYVGD